jgi:hypothetical protein
MEIVDQIQTALSLVPGNIEYILNWLAEHAPAETQLLIFAAVSPLMTIVIQLLSRNKFARRILDMENDLTRNRIAYLGALLAMAINYLVTDPSIAPYVVPLQAQVLHWINQPYFKLVIRPASVKIATKWTEAKALTQKSAPGFTLSTATNTATVPLNNFDDFSRTL